MIVYVGRKPTKSANATLLAVRKEMAKPRMAKSARGTRTILAAARIVRGSTKT